MSEKHKPMSSIVERYARFVQENCKRIISEESNGRLELIFKTDDPEKILSGFGEDEEKREYDEDEE